MYDLRGKIPRTAKLSDASESQTLKTLNSQLHFYSKNTKTSAIQLGCGNYIKLSEKQQKTNIYSYYFLTIWHEIQVNSMYGKHHAVYNFLKNISINEPLLYLLNDITPK